jgi:predicted RecB family endonuclease
MVALMDAEGCSAREIAEALGYSPNHVWRIQNCLPGYRVLVDDLKHKIQERYVEEVVDAVTKLNSKVPVMIDNLENLALSAKRDGVRLSATKDWLDRAPDAPKRAVREEHVEERKIIFTLANVENMKSALEDVGKAKVVELLEGEDYTVADPTTGINVDED